MATAWRERLLGPLHSALKDMEGTKRNIQEDANITLRNLGHAEATCRKHYQQARELAERAAIAKSEFEALLLRRQPAASAKDIDRAKRRKEEAEQKRAIAEQVWKQSQTTYQSLLDQFKIIDMPRIIHVRTKQIYPA